MKISMKLRSAARQGSTLTEQMQERFMTATRITAVGALLGGLEELSRRSEMHDRGLFSWPVRRTSLRSLSNPRLDPVTKTFEHPRYQKLVGLRAASAAIVLFAPSRSGIRTASLLGLSGFMLTKSYRHTYGSDGSDQMSFITTTVAGVASLPGLGKWHRAVLAGFLAFQSTLSYFSAGVAKLRSPAWRDGSAVTGIFRTKTYGDEQLYRFIRDRPWAAKALAWSVILAETSFPVVLLLPPLPRRALLGLAASFHVANARFMGLNRFFWAFLGTYPVVDQSAEDIRRAISQRRRK
jgi:hypothetical protein